MELKPQVAAALEKMGPEQVGLTVDQIESHSASVGDLLARIAYRGDPNLIQLDIRIVRGVKQSA